MISESIININEYYRKYETIKIYNTTFVYLLDTTFKTLHSSSTLFFIIRPTIIYNNSVVVVVGDGAPLKEMFWERVFAALANGEPSRELGILRLGAIGAGGALVGDTDLAAFADLASARGVSDA